MWPTVNVIKKSEWGDCDGRHWKFGPVRDDIQIMWVVGKELEETDYILTSDSALKNVSVDHVLKYKRIQTGGFKMEVAITIN
jgi:hypothetical protein